MEDSGFFSKYGRFFALFVAVIASFVALFGIASTVFLWRNPDLWCDARPPAPIFRVQSRSMEPEYRGPRFLWTCPRCGSSFATSFDVSFPSETASESGSELTETDGVSGATSSDGEGDSAPLSPGQIEARRVLSRLRVLTCTECGYDRVPATDPQFEEGSTVSVERPKTDSRQLSFREKLRRAWRREINREYREQERQESRVRPRRWDVVIFRDASGRLTLKRIAGLPGEQTSLCNGDVLINGEAPERTTREALSMASPVESVEYRRSDKRLDVVHVSKVWNGESAESTPSAISNESCAPCLNGSNLSRPELVRDFMLNFNWYSDDGATMRFAVLIRRPTRAFLLVYDESTLTVTLRAKELFDGAAPSGKKFELLEESDFANETGVRVELDGPAAPNAVFTLATLDGTLRFAIDGEDRASFSTDDLESTVTAPISEPFAILGDSVRVSNAALYRDLHYSRVNDDFSGESGEERSATLHGSSVLTPKGRYFVLGDNSPASIDSRYSSSGTVAEEDVLFVAARR